MRNNKEEIREKCEYTFSKLMMYMDRYMYVEEIKKGICRSCSAANPSFLCAAVWLELRFLCLVAVRVRSKSLSSSGHFLCLVAVCVRLKHCRRPGCLQLNWPIGHTYQKGDSSKWCSEQQSVFRRTMHNGPT